MPPVQRRPTCTGAGITAGIAIMDGTVIATGIAATGIDCRSLDAADLTGIG